MDEIPVGRMRAEVDPVVAPVLAFDWEREIERLQREQPWQEAHNAKTLAHFDDLRLVLLVLKTGAHIPRHPVAGRVVLQALRGYLHITLTGQSVDLKTGNALVLDRDIEHEIVAAEESALLMTIVWPANRRGDG